MIQANELRIGNVIEGRYGPCRVIGITGRHSQFIEYEDTDNDKDGSYAEDIEPIPLTHEILEKAGFKEIKDGKRGIGVFMNSIYDFEETLLGSGVYSLAIHEEYTQTKIKYLHQLQNLYFALTCEELEISI